jgi:hypothetical protein
MAITFITNVQTLGENSTIPNIVTVRPILSGAGGNSLDILFAGLAPSIVDAVVNAVRNYNPVWSRYRVVERTRGKLLATNEVNGNMTGFTAGFNSLEEITPEVLADIFLQIQQSNADVLITDIEWSFIISPNSITVGGAPDQRVKPPSWAPAIKLRNTWLGWKVNCAAYALNYLMHNEKREYRKNLKRAIEDAEYLQRKLGWGDFIAIKDLQDFVDEYDEYRVTVVHPSILQTSPSWIFIGKKWVPDFSTGRCPEKTLYLVYDITQKHFAATKCPGQLITRYKNCRYKWCYYCDVGFLEATGHICPDQPPAPKKLKRLPPCQKCGVLSVPGKLHSCPLVTCKMCSSIYKKAEGYNHRCIVYKEPRKDERNTFCNDKDKADGSLFSLWVYDFESRLEIAETNRDLITGFKTDGVHYANLDVCIYEKKISKHEVNLVAFKNVFTDEEYCYYGDGALEDFITFMLQYNGGKNICIAHNAAGYDTRLLFSKLKLMNQKVSLIPIMRGGKFMQLKVNKNLIFRDSLLHVKGSLKSLAKDFCDGLLEKGYFPHLYNSLENYGYVGPIPDKKYFDLSFSVRNQKEMDDFDAWYATWAGRDDWNFDSELSKYCKNDVDVLQKIVKGYHDIAVAKFGMSPWFNATAPSFVHEVILVQFCKDLELPDKKENMEEYKEKILELAWDEYWGVLQPNEYWFARKALRGGRTEIRKMYHKVSDDDWNRGVRIRYQDICSQYPYQQVVHDFPVGLPLIYVWDKKYFPCIAHQNNPDVHCSCGPDKAIPDRFCRIVKEKEQWTVEQILQNKKFFGIVCASLEPNPNLIHPVLVVFDEKLGKSVATCEPITEGVFTSVEFITALQNGYTLKKLHRYDQYNKRPSLWRDIVLDLFLEKMINSKAAPEGEKAKKLVNDYAEEFGEDIAEKIEESLIEGRWGKNPAKKQTFKITMNSAWGKNAERPIMPEVAIFNCQDQTEDIYTLLTNCDERNYDLHSYEFLNDDHIMAKYSVSGKDTRPNLHGGYLPAALFVPAYGRLQLWHEMNKLGKRVLMNDTDSIVYVYDPAPGQYNIPEGGLLGQWEVEDEDRENGGIKEFVGLGPKTYGFKCANGYTKVKAKGLSLNLATETRINFETMKDLALAHLLKKKQKENLTDAEKELLKKTHIMVPQKTFVWSSAQGMRTWCMQKVLKIEESAMKGKMDNDGYLYPFGFVEK